MVDAPGTHQHELIKAQKFADVSVGLLSRELVLANLMWRWSAMDFAGAADDTINVKVPGTLKARDRQLRAVGEDRRIEMDFLRERKIGVKLDKFPYSATEVTDEQLSLDVTDFSQQILQPQVTAIAEYVENAAVSLLENATYADGRLSKDREKIEDASKIKGTLKAEDFYGPGKFGMASLFNRVRTNLIKRGVGAQNITVAVGADVEEVLLEEQTLLDASFSGDNSALRDATIGRLRGFNFVTVPYLKENEAYVFHNTAFVLATAAPQIPQGAVYGSTANGNGTALRWLRDYEADYAVDRSIVDTFLGTGTVSDVSMGDGKEHLLRAMKITMDRNKVEDAKKAGAQTAPASGAAAGQ